ncbi:hypothetical protein SE00_09250 [Staphylococcus saprophyticus]|uniref:hypothetical protein n=1 Tax=Staphylococcus saprophyticus TaxID=29385 RepID=UPI00059798FF|nr:hypothetical protein [Staphylococcus saprophyticus]KIJ86241.1 hypothetical protein SE00_09250 [Staphylococcus saprophyticus]
MEVFFNIIYPILLASGGLLLKWIYQKINNYKSIKQANELVIEKIVNYIHIHNHIEDELLQTIILGASKEYNVKLDKMNNLNQAKALIALNIIDNIIFETTKKDTLLQSLLINSEINIEETQEDSYYNKKKIYTNFALVFSIIYVYIFLGGLYIIYTEGKITNVLLNQESLFLLVVIFMVVVLMYLMILLMIMNRKNKRKKS